MQSVQSLRKVYPICWINKYDALVSTEVAIIAHKFNVIMRMTPYR